MLYSAGSPLLYLVAAAACLLSFLADKARLLRPPIPSHPTPKAGGPRLGCAPRIDREAARRQVALHRLYRTPPRYDASLAMLAGRMLPVAAFLHVAFAAWKYSSVPPPLDLPLRAANERTCPPPPVCPSYLTARVGGADHAERARLERVRAPSQARPRRGTAPCKTDLQKQNRRPPFKTDSLDSCVALHFLERRRRPARGSDPRARRRAGRRTTRSSVRGSATTARSPVEPSPPCPLPPVRTGHVSSLLPY
jgi:hypothetical protein